MKRTTRNLYESTSAQSVILKHRATKESPQILLTQARIMMPSTTTFAAALLLGLAPLTLGSIGVHHSVMDIIENNKDARWFVAEKGNP